VGRAILQSGIARGDIFISSKVWIEQNYCVDDFVLADADMAFIDRMDLGKVLFFISRALTKSIACTASVLNSNLEQ